MTRDWIRSAVPRVRYVPFAGASGTAQALNEVFRQARGRAVLCLDCHVLLAAGAVRKLIEYYAAHRECRDLLTGPLLRDSRPSTHTETHGAALGTMGVRRAAAVDAGEPFESSNKEWDCSRADERHGSEFHPQFRGPSGCETYVMEKFRRRGGRVLCCPWLRWTHRFRRVGGVPYPVRQQDKLRNYLIGFRELGLDTRPLLEHFQVSAAQADALLPSIPDAAALAVVGSHHFVGVNMRGRVLAEHLGCKLLRPQHVADMKPRETIVAIKKNLPWRWSKPGAHADLRSRDTFGTYGHESPVASGVNGTMKCNATTSGDQSRLLHR